MRFPIMVAPTALQGPVHADGESGMRRAAVAASNTPIILRYPTSSTPIEKFAAAAATGQWYKQFYPQEDRDNGRELLDADKRRAVPHLWSPSGISSARRPAGARSRRAISVVDRRSGRRTRRRRGHRRSANRHRPLPPPDPALWYTWSY